MYVNTETRGELKIQFGHSHPLKARSLKDAGTYCMIEKDGVVISQGRSHVHSSDIHSFSKERGRKIALGRAVKALLGNGLRTKSDRESIWKAYLQR